MKSHGTVVCSSERGSFLTRLRFMASFPRGILVQHLLRCTTETRKLAPRKLLIVFSYIKLQKASLHLQANFPSLPKTYSPPIKHQYVTFSSRSFAIFSSSQHVQIRHRRRLLRPPSRRGVPGRRRQARLSSTASRPRLPQRRRSVRVYPRWTGACRSWLELCFVECNEWQRDLKRLGKSNRLADRDVQCPCDQYGL